MGSAAITPRRPRPLERHRTPPLADLIFSRHNPLLLSSELHPISLFIYLVLIHFGESVRCSSIRLSEPTLLFPAGGPAGEGEDRPAVEQTLNFSDNSKAYPRGKIITLRRGTIGIDTLEDRSGTQTRPDTHTGYTRVEKANCRGLRRQLFCFLFPRSLLICRDCCF